MKTMNRGAILNLLNKTGTMSRVELANALGLDGTTVTHIIRDLLATDLVRAVGFTAPSMGRPKEILRLNADGRNAIGIHLDSQKLSGAIVNLGGEVKIYEELTLSATDSRHILLRKITKVIKGLLRNSDKSTLLGIGLAYHGIVDNKTGIVRQAAHLPGWEGVDIHTFFSQTFGIPFEIEDNSRTKAIAEYWYGVARGICDFVLLDIGDGIGCAVMTNGIVQCGATNSAGEIGHNPVVWNGKSCRCGRTGCLETVASMSALQERLSDYGNKVSFEDIVRLSSQGNDDVIKTINEVGGYIGLATSSLINILNPSHLVLSGELLRLGVVLENAIRKAIERHTIDSSYKALKIMKGKLGNHCAVVGAATLMLKKVFERIV